MRQNIRFMIDAIPGRPLDATAMGGDVSDDARFTLEINDGNGSAKATMHGTAALCVAKGIVNCLMRAGMDISSVPDIGGAFVPFDKADG